MNIVKYFGIIALLLLVACTPAQEEIRIGGLFHLTGDAAQWGQAEYNAVQMAVEEINAQGGINELPIRLIMEDTQTNFPLVATATQKLIGIDSVHAIIGPTWFGQVAAPIAEEEKIVMISPSTGVVVPREQYFYNLYPTQEQEAKRLVEYLVQKNISQMAVVYTLQTWSEGMKEAFAQEAKRNNIEINQEYAVSLEETSFQTIITKINMLDIDALYLATSFYPQEGAFMKQYVALHGKHPIYSTSNTHAPDLLEAFPEVEGVMYAYPKSSQKEEEFLEKYSSRFGPANSPTADDAYDAVYLLKEIIEDVGTDSLAMAKALEEIQFSGVNEYSFANGRIEKKEHEMYVIQNSEFALLS